jgi:hypothetical protein
MAGYKKFLKSSDIYGESNQGASWSDVDGFYKRVHWLITEAHSSSNDDEDIKDYFMILEQLHLEIIGVLSVEDQALLETRRRETWKIVNSKELDTKALCYKREKVRPYHLMMSRYLHSYGLLLKKNASDYLDGLLK